jgi:hypothetical protein
MPNRKKYHIKKADKDLLKGFRAWLKKEG